MHEQPIVLVNIPIRLVKDLLHVKHRGTVEVPTFIVEDGKDFIIPGDAEIVDVNWNYEFRTVTISLKHPSFMADGFCATEGNGLTFLCNGKNQTFSVQ